MRSSLAWAAVMAAMLAASGCSHKEKVVNETGMVNPLGFGCLARADELADDPLHPPTPPFCRIALLSSVAVAGKPLPRTALIDRGSECLRTPRGYAVDLAPGVAARVHELFNLDPIWQPMDQSPACPPQEASGPVPALPDGAPTALLFRTTDTVPATTASGGKLILPAAIEAEVVEAVSGRVLWHDTCRTDTAELTAAATFPDIGNMRHVLSDEALRCAQGFAASLGARPPV